MSTSPEAPPQDPPQAEKLKVSRTRKLVRVLLALMVVFLGLFCVLLYQMCGCGEAEEICIATAAEAQMNTLGTALHQYKKLQGRLPTTEEGLKALVEPPAKAQVQRKLAESSAISDPWGHPYQYRFHETQTGPSFDLWSFGLDGIEGTKDDVIHRKLSAKQ